jgi:Kef-type K+ transport system membrane component KefB
MRKKILFAGMVIGCILAIAIIILINIGGNSQLISALAEILIFGIIVFALYFLVELAFKKICRKK